MLISLDLVNLAGLDVGISLRRKGSFLARFNTGGDSAALRYRQGANRDLQVCGLHPGKGVN